MMVDAVPVVTPADGLRADPGMLLTSGEVAAVLGISASGWRSLVSQGYAPKPDVPDTARPVNRRTPQWRADTIADFRVTRASAGWKRKSREAGR